MRHVILRMMTTHTRAGVSDPEVPQWQEVSGMWSPEPEEDEAESSRSEAVPSQAGALSQSARGLKTADYWSPAAERGLGVTAVSRQWPLLFIISVLCFVSDIIWYLVSPWARGMIWCSQPGSYTQLSLSSSGRLNYTSPHSGWPSSVVSK